MRALTPIVIALLIIGLTACTTGHSSQYRDIDHLQFSWCGYKNPTQEDAKKSKDQKWFGKEVVVEDKGTISDAQIDQLEQLIFHFIEGKDIAAKEVQK